MSGLLRDLVFENPILAHAARRGRKYVRGVGAKANYVWAFIIPLVYFLGLALMIADRSNWVSELQIVELTAITLIMPFSTYAAIAGEREKATWEGLMVTPLSIEQILTGQLLWRVLIIVGIMALYLASLLMIPLLGLSGTPGPQLYDVGYSGSGHPTPWMPHIDRDWDLAHSLLPPLDIFVPIQALVFTWGLMLSSFGLCVSANSNRSASAAGIIAAIMLGLLLLIPVLLPQIGFAPNSFLYDVSMIFNPFHAVASYQMSRGYSYAVSGYTEFLPIVAFVYFIGAVAFTYATHLRLRRWKIDKGGAVRSWQAH